MACGASHALERIVFELPAVVAGSDKAALGAEIRFVVELPGVDTVGAESIDLFSEQHAGHLLFAIIPQRGANFQPEFFAAGEPAVRKRSTLRQTAARQDKA